MEDVLKCLVEMQKKYKEVCTKHEGIISINHDDRVQVSKSFLLNMPGKMNEEPFNFGGYMFKGYKYFDGIKFFALSEYSLVAESNVKSLIKEEATLIGEEIVQLRG